MSIGNQLKNNGLRYALTAAKFASVALSLAFLLGFLAVAGGSITHPFALQWMEGQSIDMVARVLQGQPLYPEPSIEYAAAPYPPLFYILSAFTVWFTGLDFLPARIVSLLATLVSGLLLYGWVRHEKGSRSASVIAAGLFFASYIVTGRWFDLARVDSLFIALTLAGFYVLAHKRGLASVICSGALLTAAFFTKQTALLIIIAGLLGMFAQERKYALLAALFFTLFSVCLVGWNNAISKEWFNFYVFTLRSSADGIEFPKPSFQENPFFVQMGIAGALAVLSLALRFRTHWKKACFLTCLFIGMALAGYSSHNLWQEYQNVFIPLCAGFALLAGMLLATAERFFRPVYTLCLYLAVLAQLVLLAYNPNHFIPTQSARDEGVEALTLFSQLRGPVLVPEMQFVQTRVEKTSYSAGVASYIVNKRDLGLKDSIRKTLSNEFQEAIARQRFAAIIPSRALVSPGLDQYYEARRVLWFPEEYTTGSSALAQLTVYAPKRSKP